MDSKIVGKCQGIQLSLPVCGANSSEVFLSSH